MVCVRSVLVCSAILAATAANPCKQLQNGTLNNDQGVENDGACSCPGDKPCLRLCNTSLDADGGFNESFRNENISIQLENLEKNSSHQVLLFDHFALVPESNCQRALESLEEIIFTVNGSIQSSDVGWLLHPEEFCVTQINDSLEVFVCSNSNEEKGWRFYLYPPFFILSAVCLALTLFAYQFCQETKTLHEKAIYCQSTALFFSFVTLTINYLTGDTSHIYVCKILAYTNYFFLLASFFWLNVMCIDIFLTFRSLTRVTRPKYWQASIYAWGIPFLLLVTTIVFDQKTKGPYSPGIGENSCWFNGILAEVIYFHGLVMALLLINLVLFGLTAYHLWIVSAESKRVLQSPESGKQKASSDRTRQDSDRFILFIKLFLLMGCTWLMEIVSWAVGGDESIWYFPDVINSTRGVLVFWFCVWSKKALRKSLLQMLCKCATKEKKEASDQNSTEVNVNNSSFSGSSLTLQSERILAELIYFHGPVIALLLINLVLFGLTAYNLWIVSSESKRVLQSPESGKQKASSDQALQESDRFVLFIKLFLLMGCTWLMEIVSWAVGGDEIIWFLPDVINSTRGVFVFWFCVWSKKALRKSLFRFLCKCVKNEKKQLSEHNSTEIIVNDTSIYGSYREIYGQW
ncbi:G-protein coupled receptor Mth2-like [Cloeon dipterum]|uniref:G-protein coupled receptor Mth2-like n=1 Tax=Cloeon dipterum TaxID=197152 RepID=UPI0032200DAF